MKARIPTTHENWIDYKEGNVYLISYDSKGNRGDFQYDGTSCRQNSVTGYAAYKFQSVSKYFNPNFWYKKTCWGNDYPHKIYFDTKREIKALVAPLMYMSHTRKERESLWKKIDKEADKYARPSANILKAIIKEASTKTGLTLEPDFENMNYGISWWEAYVPVIDENCNRYILTWQNCD
jgi:hypothetical protein